jgi:hypothetical protein
VPGLSEPLADFLKSGKVGLTAAMPPLRRGRVRDPRYDASPEFKDLIDQAQIVCRDEHWHAAHLRLRTAGTVRHKLDWLTQDVRARRGVETAPSDPFYKEFGTAS